MKKRKQHTFGKKLESIVKRRSTAKADKLDPFYDEEFVRKFLGYKSIKILRQVRARKVPGRHPPSVRVGTSTRYPKAQFEAWVAGLLEAPAA